MKLYKLKWLLYFLAYRLNRWFEGTTKWEQKDPQAISTSSWEFCMFLNSMKLFERIYLLEERGA